MGRYTTKEDDVDRISTSVYVTNFPDNVSAKELFLACKQYGHVVDSYIPVKKSKYGKRFGFVKFINVFSEERLVNNLCTVWIGRVRLHANIARFQRPNGKNIGEGNKKPNVTPTPSVKPNLSGSLGNEKSYRGVLNGDTKTKLVGKISEPSIVLGDECVMSMNVDNALFGRVKVFASLANLKMALGNEGFSDIDIKYMGEQWVMLEFKSLESMEKFKKCISVMSWFSQVIKATNEFEVDGRIAWVEVEGVPFKLWTDNTFTRIAEKWGKLLDVDDQDETCFHSKRLCVYLKAGNSIREDFKITHRGKMYWIRANETQGWVPEFTDEYESEDDNSMDEEGEVKKNGIKDEHSDGEIVPESLFEDGELENNHVDGIFSKKEKEVSEDPFNLYSLLKRQNKLDDKDTNSEDSLKHPPGFTPLTHNCENDTSEKKVDQNDEFSEAGDVDKLKGSANGSISTGHFKVSEIPRTGGSMVGLLEDVIKVGRFHIEQKSDHMEREVSFKFWNPIRSKSSMVMRESGIKLPWVQWKKLLLLKIHGGSRHPRECWNSLKLRVSESVPSKNSPGAVIKIMCSAIPHGVPSKNTRGSNDVGSAGVMQLKLIRGEGDGGGVVRLWRWWWDCGGFGYNDGGGGDSGWRWWFRWQRWRVAESEYGDRVDPLMRITFGVRRKKSPEKFSGGGDLGRPVAAGYNGREGR
ncbi:nucleotide-binding alpha-beta plait domain-containing protein [Tanacetum coccineum]